MPVGVTIRAELSSPLSLAVTLHYRYMSIDPHIAPSPLLQARMPLFAAGTYAAAIDIGDQAPKYLQGSEGSLQYQIQAQNSDGALTQGGPASIGVRHCSSANSVAAQSAGIRSDR
jgi:hypothetical protein